MDSVTNIQRIVERKQVKVVFFGETGNGKSTVINAVLHAAVLPVSIGHVTNCFISITGCEEKEGYLLVSGCNKSQQIQVCKHVLRFCIIFYISGYPQVGKFFVQWSMSW